MGIKEGTSVNRGYKLSLIVGAALVVLLLVAMLTIGNQKPVLSGIGQANGLTTQTVTLNYSNGEHMTRTSIVLFVSNQQSNQATEILKRGRIAWFVLPMGLSDAQVAPLLTPEQKRQVDAIAQPHVFELVSNRICLEGKCVDMP
jgi:hypothetical protein